MIRTVKEQDLPAITTIIKTTLEEHIIESGGAPDLVTEEFLRSTLEKSSMLVTEFQGEVIGYLQYQVCPPNLIINGTAIQPEHQRNGHGESMFAVAAQEATYSCCQEVIISVQPSNRGIYQLYKRLGFKEGENPSGWNQELRMSMKKTLTLLKKRKTI